MEFVHQLKIVLITIIAVLCSILLFNLIRKLRSVLPWRVNCWFCNHNQWVKYPETNCWTCPKCEQYNGFTKDGDYNKQLFNHNDHNSKIPKVFRKSPPKNGLCKMCNINQQLKVAQLANFVPMNERNYDNEIDSYRLQLEKAYKLCSPCKKVVQMKLYKEKESLLGSKLLHSRTPEKKSHIKSKENEMLTNTISKITLTIVSVLIALVSIECCRKLISEYNLTKTLVNYKEIVYGLIERLVSIVKVKSLVTFPSLSNLHNVTSYLNIDIIPNYFYDYFNLKSFDQMNEMLQEIIGGICCLIQILGHVLNVNRQKYAFINDILLTAFMTVCMAQYSVPTSPIVLCFVKLLCICSVFVANVIWKTKVPKSLKPQSPPSKMKNLARANFPVEDDDTSALDTDDDVSLSKFGVHNYTDSSNEASPLNCSKISGRMFTPRTSDSAWSKPKLNSTFCVNSMTSKSPSSVSETVFVKPSFNKYQKFMKEDSDSELDDSISTLCIGSPRKAKSQTNSIFSLRKFTATPSFVTPATTFNGRPLISPSKLGHGTSWVAGGYWGTEAERQIFVNGSRSSSQSSGFESQASSVNQRNVFSSESDCIEADRAAMLMDRFQGCNMSNYPQQMPQNFSRVSSPVYPSMQYNGHVHIPQARMAAAPAPPATPAHFTPGNMFIAPGGSGIIKLPQMSSYSSR
ncbi:unnamed protein product [Plutella xylostella]|uniref:(diamondback moth) hypothetical protein n=1 Tax=Plutella xylostella TaxID=51655 RepID=A0A8S4EJH0_PLUXY|nr:unnamed protein product [Plutella xylostella]